MNKLQILEDKALEIVKEVADDPQGRYNLRYQFYQKYGDPFIHHKSGLGNSELAFIKWEIRRGVLNPIHHLLPGSPWWRKVNSYFIYLATLAQLIYESGENFDHLPAPVTFWLDYIKKPNECSWYRAHNSSIIAGYEVADPIAFNENIYEQYFVNIVLYRLLYAQSIVEGVSFGLLGKILGNPRGFAVSIITDIESFYPSHYPLSKQDIKYITHKAHNFEGVIEDIFDELFILPHLDKLYKEAADWNDSPVILNYIKNNHPCYPVSIMDTHDNHFKNTLTLRNFFNS